MPSFLSLRCDQFWWSFICLFVFLHFWPIQRLCYTSYSFWPYSHWDHALGTRKQENQRNGATRLVVAFSYRWHIKLFYNLTTTSVLRVKCACLSKCMSFHFSIGYSAYSSDVRAFTRALPSASHLIIESSISEHS